MKVPTVGWAFFGLVVLLVAWHFLERGIFIGSSVQMIHRPYGEAYVHKCQYLYIDGVRETVEPRVVIPTKQEAEAQFCPPTPSQER